jgi:hypothetical protein
MVLTGRPEEIEPSWFESMVRAGLRRLELGMLDMEATRAQARELLAPVFHDVVEGYSAGRRFGRWF